MESPGDAAAAAASSLSSPTAAVEAALDRAQATQRSSYAAMLSALQQLTTALEASSAAPAALVKTAKGAKKTLSAQQKESGKALTALGKAIDRAFPAPPTATSTTGDDAGTSAAEMDRSLINCAIAVHLLRSGRFRLAEQFVAEAGVDLPEDAKAPFVELYVIADELRRRNVDLALEWAAARQPASPLDFHLVRMRYLDVLATDGAVAALRYARDAFARFWARGGAFDHELRTLLGLLVFAGGGGGGGGSGATAVPARYAALLGPRDALWSALEAEFSREYCAAAGLAEESPLFTALRVGATALPVLTKMGSIVSTAQGGSGGDWTRLDVLPVEIDLGRGGAYHSIFACPVSKEVATEDNPPVMLPCGHALSKQSVSKVARGSSRLKCPYCPSESSVSSCRVLYF